MTRLVQLQKNGIRRIAVVEEPHLLLLNDQFPSIYELARKAISASVMIPEVIQTAKTAERIAYDEVYFGESEWRILPSVDHPVESMRCIVSGTGLTHKASAVNRQKMHESLKEESLTDSMRMYLWGEEGGKPEQGKIGVQPEWFYKGNGTILRAHGQTLNVPSYADDGGEEPEIAGIYLIGDAGEVFRIGFTTGNEFSDHIMEKKNYLYLAPSKLRQCAVGPEIVITDQVEDIAGKVNVLRNDSILWTKGIHTGNKHMAHSIANLEYHHFKYGQHRVPDQLHVHFLGADAFSFGEKIKLQDGDQMEVDWNEMGRPLVNKLSIDQAEEKLVVIRSLGK